MFATLNIFQEFWFTAVTTFLYFTAFVAELAEFAEMEADNEFSQTWIDAQVAAGVRAFNLKFLTQTQAFLLHWDTGTYATDVTQKRLRGHLSDG